MIRNIYIKLFSDGRTMPNLEDLEMAFQEMGISISELEEYVSNVEQVSYPHEVPKLPLQRPSNLNFIKPGAKEIVSRPLHVNEHLPPMFPEKEGELLENLKLLLSCGLTCSLLLKNQNCNKMVLQRVKKFLQQALVLSKMDLMSILRQNQAARQ